MNSLELPLFGLFSRLREHGLQLGVEQYLLALHALRAGFGIASGNGLLRLCKLLWIKSSEEERILDGLAPYLFSSFLESGQSTTIELPYVPPDDHEQMGPTTPSVEVENPQDSSAGSDLFSNDQIKLGWGKSGDRSNLQLQVVKAFRQADTQDSRYTGVQLLHSRYRRDYFPVSHRQMKQTWRSFRRLTREGPPEELDVVATIERLSRTGVLLEPVLVPKRINRAELVLLVDWGGSMVPFHAIANQLLSTASRGGRFWRLAVFYFHNYPSEFLYRDSSRLQAERIDTIFPAHGTPRAVLIISDAGAARGYQNRLRVEATGRVLAILKESVRYVSWLNPVPRRRWSGTTAAEIRKLVPMFDMSRHEFAGAIKSLRGGHPAVP